MKISSKVRMASKSFLSYAVFCSLRLVGVLTGRWDAESGPTMSGKRVLDTGARRWVKEFGGTRKGWENTQKIR